MRPELRPGANSQEAFPVSVEAILWALNLAPVPRDGVSSGLGYDAVANPSTSFAALKMTPPAPWAGSPMCVDPRQC